MKLSLLIFSLLIITSCQKDIRTYLIQPPNSKGEKVSEIFPYEKYTTVKSYSFNKPDSLYYADFVISIREVNLKAPWDDEFIDNEERWKVFTTERDKQLYGIEQIVSKSGKPIAGVIEHLELGFKKISQFSACFDTVKVYETLDNGKVRPMKPKSESECIPTYRDALVFFNDNKPIAYVWICFECDKIQLQPNFGKKIFYYKSTWDKLEKFFESIGHDVNYHKNR